MKIYSEECFGPVKGIVRINGVEEAKTPSCTYAAHTRRYRIRMALKSLTLV